MESLVVQKYGGSSLSSLKKLQSIAKHLAEIAKTKSLIVVVSAMGKATDQLLNMAYSISEDPEKRELDMLLTAGERISMSLLSIALNELGVSSMSLTGSQAGIFTSSKHSSASIVELKPFRVSEILAQKKIAILAGFQGVDPITKEITTLGRGGSDTTAVHLANYFKAPCEIYKDVDGVCSADPHQGSKVTKYDQVTYDELISMTKWGNPILHRDCIGLAKEKKVNLTIKKSLSANRGTQLVVDNKEIKNQCLSTENHASVFCIKPVDIKNYRAAREKEKLFTLYDLYEKKNYLLITGEASDLQLLQNTILKNALIKYSTISFILSKNCSQKNRDNLKNHFSKKFPSLVDWIDEDCSLTAVVLPADKDSFLNASALFLKNYHLVR